MRRGWNNKLMLLLKKKGSQTEFTGQWPEGSSERKGKGTPACSFTQIALRSTSGMTLSPPLLEIKASPTWEPMLCVVLCIEQTPDRMTSALGPFSHPPCSSLGMCPRSGLEAPHPSLQGPPGGTTSWGNSLMMICL